MPGATGHGVGTPPRGMLLAVLSLMYIIMALNHVHNNVQVMEYTAAGDAAGGAEPDVNHHGSQHCHVQNTVLQVMEYAAAGNAAGRAEPHVHHHGPKHCHVHNTVLYRSWSTPPRGMLLAVLSLMYIIMALNIVMFALVPDYTMFGNQHFQHNITGKGSPAPRSFHLPQL